MYLQSFTTNHLTDNSRWNPDPHVLRVNDTYYLAVSSFNIYPGVPIYSSKNLADWELISHAINRPNQVPLYGSRTNNGNIKISIISLYPSAC